MRVGERKRPNSNVCMNWIDRKAKIETTLGKVDSTNFHLAETFTSLEFRIETQIAMICPTATICSIASP